MMVPGWPLPLPSLQSSALHLSYRRRAGLYLYILIVTPNPLCSILLPEEAFFYSIFINLLASSVLTYFM